MPYGPEWAVPERLNFTRDVVEHLADDPTRRALTFVARDGIVERFTFAELARRAAGWATLLLERQIGLGDRVMVLLDKRPAWHGVILGALKIGAVTVPCSEMLRARDLAYRARHSGAKLLVAQPSTREEVEGMLALLETPIDVLYVADETELLVGRPPVFPTRDTAHDDPAFILYTSGTTKDPRGVTHTHAYTFATGAQAQYWLDARPGDLVWCTAGTGWAKSIWNVLLGPWSIGAEVMMHAGPFTPVERFELLERLGVTVLCQAPTEYRLMAKVEDLEIYDLRRLRHAVSAGEPLNPEVINVFRDTFGITVYDGYGQTENTLLVANLPGTEVRPGSMGHPTPGHTVAVVDEKGRETPPGVEGDIALYGRPPGLFAGYWNDPEATASAFRGDWYLTGDRARRDKDGYFWFTGRADDVILSAAYRISPFEVESALLEHPAVAESAVVGKPDADRGQIVKAFVVLRSEHEGGDELVAELQEHVRTVTAPYKYPREIEFVEALPKTTSGKIRRVELRAQEQAAAGLEPPPAVEPAPPLRIGAAGDRLGIVARVRTELREIAERSRRDETIARQLREARLKTLQRGGAAPAAAPERVQAGGATAAPAPSEEDALIEFRETFDDHAIAESAHERVLHDLQEAETARQRATAEEWRRVQEAKTRRQESREEPIEAQPVPFATGAPPDASVGPSRRKRKADSSDDSAASPLVSRLSVYGRKPESDDGTDGPAAA
jgi:acyl-coenzyme A synthetase/AMP-(fatty) acid ligase